MSDDFDQAFEPLEASSLDAFRRLHGKVARVLVETGREAAVRWPSLPWLTKEPAIRGKILERLATHQQLIIGVPPPNSTRGIWMTYGADLKGETAVLHVAVETWPSAYETQRAILELADRAEFSAEWQRAFGAWGGVKRTQGLVEVGSPAEGTAWLLAQIADLAAAGILQVVGTGLVRT